ncbi:MAG: serine hydrolase [Bacteroidia bacterium]
MKRLIFIIGLFIGAANLFAPPVQYEIKNWADHQFDSLTIDQRIAQLFMIEVRPTYGAKHLAEVERMIKTHQVGGVIFFKGNPTQQVQLTNKYQSMSKIPLMVGIDGEWGLAMRLSNTITYPYQLGLGGIQDNSLIYDMGKEIGRQCARMGIHVNFAPVIDVNNNPNNPIINYRSFGEDPMNVGAKGWEYARGMQDQNVIACAKHFPGHGDTDVDSHKDLPVINHTMARLRAVEFKPFQYLISRGVSSVMTAHLYIPAIDNRPQTAISISDKAINGILRKEMGFTGLAFTDALNMQGVAKFHSAGELELKALQAGNDILLAPGDIPKATQLIKKAMVTGLITEDYVWGKVKKILAYKKSLGLDSLKRIEPQGLLQDLNSTSAKYIEYKLIEKQLCLIKDKRKLIPIKKEQFTDIVSIAIGSGQHFQSELSKYGTIKKLRLTKDPTPSQVQAIISQIKGMSLAIISVHGTSKYPPHYGTNRSAGTAAQAIASAIPSILVDFGNPYNLKKFKGQEAVLLAYEDKNTHHTKAAQALFGTIGVDAKLSVTVNDEYRANSGIITSPTAALNHGKPAEVGMSSEVLKEIDRIAERAVRIGATPGTQILVAKEGRIVYNKSFGKHTYTNSLRVENDHLYDLASITKVAATTLTLMKLVEDSVLSLDDHMAKYLPELLNTNKSYLTIRMVLEHKSGLKAWIPFYYSTLKDQHLYDSVFCGYPTAQHNTYMGCGLYMLDGYKEYIFQQIYDSELGTKGKYKYSDLGMILMKELIERVTSTPLDTYVNTHFYRPMGLTHLTYLPLNKFEKNKIIPTAMSPDVRKGILRGFVHDPAAAMLGGVSGHAGLFGNAESLAILMQMLLNGGELNGMRYLKPSTIEQFTSQQSRDSRRGLGWDKPEFKPRYLNPASDYASRLCFGHTGFTGTMVWADPKYDLVYVFLSNRVYPDQENKKLNRENVRTDIMDVIYKSFLHS